MEKLNLSKMKMKKGKFILCKNGIKKNLKQQFCLTRWESESFNLTGHGKVASLANIQKQY